MGLLLNGTGALVTQNMEKVEVLNAFFTLVFIGEADLQESCLNSNKKGVSALYLVILHW